MLVLSVAGSPFARAQEATPQQDEQPAKESVSKDETPTAEEQAPPSEAPAEPEVAPGKHFSPFPVIDYSGDLWTRPALTGDWWGFAGRDDGVEQRRGCHQGLG